MERIAKIIESRPGLTSDEALKSLQSHPEFKLGTIIESIQPRGNVWVAKLLEPKKAAEFPFGDDEDSDDDSEDKVEAPSEDGEDKPEPPKSDKDDSKSEKSEISELVDLVHAIADKLGIAPDLPDLEEDAPIGEPPPGPPAGPPPGPKGPGAGPHPAPKKDMPPSAAPLTGFAAQAKAGQIPSFEVGTPADITIKEAVADLKQEFPKHTVKQLRHDKASNRYLAKLSLY
jgi:hypothetical protein